MWYPRQWSIKEVLKRLDDATKNYDNHFLNIALAYGGQNELVDAVKKIGKKDIEKVIHYAELILELAYGDKR